jgi:predicted esterase
MNPFYRLTLLLICTFVYFHSLRSQTNNPSFHLDTLEHRTFKWFWDHAHPSNYQIPDREPHGQFSSIAATGFGLAAYIVGAERMYVSRKAAAERVRNTLNYLWSLPQGSSLQGDAGYRGFYYHFLDKQSVLRFSKTELSSIDTGLLMAGILACMTYFDRDEEEDIRSLADRLFRRVEFPWMVNAHGRLSMGWYPEKGFISSDWNGYNEAMLLLIQAMGAPDHGVADDAWEKWTNTYDWRTFQDQEMLNFGPLFGHQYSHMFLDFRGIQDDYMKTRKSDYFENSRKASLAQIAYAIDNPKGFKPYHQFAWGLSACDGPADDLRKEGVNEIYKEWALNRFMGYSARGVSAEYFVDDGTLTPTAVGGSIPFAPEACIATLAYFWEMLGDSLVDTYGFKDAFNLNLDFDGLRPKGWFASDKLGIDQGAILIMIANYKDGLIWDLAKRNPYWIKGLKRAGFTGGWIDGVLEPDFEQKITNMVNEDIPGDVRALFERHEFKSSFNRKLPYRLLKPKDYRESDQYPLVIFLHGAGERGTDNHAQLKNGVLAFTEAFYREHFPAFILVPQCPLDERWSEVDPQWRFPEFKELPTSAMNDLIELIRDFVIQQPGIDMERIYVCGLSMGAFGGFDLLARMPEWFAGAMLVCGGAHESIASNIKTLPISVFHCQTDHVVSVERSRAIVEALKKENAPVKYHEYRSLGHHIWQETFYNSDNIKWLFQQRKLQINDKD